MIRRPVHRAVRAALTSASSAAIFLALASAAVPQSFEYRYTPMQRGAAPVDPGPGGGGEPAACEAPWGSPVAHGESTIAFAAASVPFGQSCDSQTRSCSNGTLQGSFAFETCSVDAQDEDPDPFSFATVADAEPDTVVSSAPVQVTGFTGTLPVLVYGGIEAKSALCTSASAASCEPATAADKHVAPGQFLRLSQRTAGFGTSRTVTAQVGPVSQVWTAAVRDALDCVAPWGDTVLHQASIEAFQTPSVPYPQQCGAEQRTCTDGVLSGLNIHASCTVDEPLVLQPFPLGSALELDPGALAYSNQVRITGLPSTSLMTVAASYSPATLNVSTCVGAGCPATGWSTWSAATTPRNVAAGTWIQFRWTAPTFGASRQATVTVAGISETFSIASRAGLSCDTPWGTPLAHGQSKTAYTASSLPYNSTCSGSSRSCTDGVLGGSASHTFDQCTVDTIPRPQPFSYPDSYGPAGSATLVRSPSLRPTNLGVSGNIPITVSGPGEFNRNGNGTCSDGTWLSAVTQSQTTMSSGNYLCMRATPGTTPGQIKTFTVTIGDQSATWRLIAQ